MRHSAWQAKLTIPLRVFVGFDDRQPASTAVLTHSILKRSSLPVAVVPLVLGTLPIKRQGLTPFTFSRYLVPYLCGFQGLAVFLDADQLVLGDIADLVKQYDGSSAVQVVHHDMVFERPSVMLFDCAHPDNRVLNPSYVETDPHISSFSWTTRIGSLPPEWNHLVGYDPPRSDPKLIHFTQGVPAWPETHNCEHGETWRRELKDMLWMQPWAELMARSVHAVTHNGKQLPRLAVEGA